VPNVAGGTGGLGRAVTLAFLKAGANVAVIYRKRKEFTGRLRISSSRTMFTRVAIHTPVTHSA